MKVLNNNNLCALKENYVVYDNHRSVLLENLVTYS